MTVRMERFTPALILVLASSLSVAWAADVPGITQINPAAIVYSAATGKVYAVDKAHDAVVITDDSTGKTVATKVGAGPLSIAANTLTGKVYVTNADDGTVSVIDGSTDAVVSTIKVGAHPYAIAINSGTGEVYVSRTYSNELTVIQESSGGATNRVAGIKAGSPDALAVDEKSGAVYLIGYESDTVGVMDGRSRTLTKRAGEMHLWGVAVNDATGVVYATRIEDRSVLALRPDGTRTVIPAGGNPCAVAINTKINRVYAVNYADDSVTVIDGATEKAIATVHVGRRPEGIALDVTTNHIYVANTLGNSVTVIDGANNKVLDTMDTGKSPYALAVNPESGKVHIADLTEVATTVIEPH